ncbi:ELWxxDGT repeat protein [Paramagnetospirillum magneticum]|uniref:RTX toxins and related Ca2+-binding protein n=1 Tax=Paramagnetospirillum magneticum (strain ATCC 700264 / AMB-1) TaxID=342108 RepID=Q2W244_PARM1|nr:ELWxxDGT repeat protein [Paramagnetospirillum magneticum]BAE52081.1 RTX toxins and related Ca2+-binding protein [Paramagnetospirillum magneticum AMB-1]
MFDGAAAMDAAHAPPDSAAKALIPDSPAPVQVRAADQSQDGGKKQVVFVDTSVADYKTLEAAVGDGIEIQEISGVQSGLAQIAKWAETQSGYDSISILSHGSQGVLTLGSDTLDASNLSGAVTQAELAQIGHALKAGGDLMLYGCDVAKGEDGQHFIETLAEATGADVAASDNTTGRNGDWRLERSTGTITSSAIDVPDYAAALAVTTNIWVSDGTSGGTSILKEINPGSSSNPKDLIVFNGKLFFTATDSTNGRELWVTDGTEAGTQLVKDIRPGSSDAFNSSYNQFVVCNGWLYFAANNGTNGAELWRTDGTTANTQMVTDLWSGSSGGVSTGASQTIAALNNTLYFVGNSSAAGSQLWSYDGTTVSRVHTVWVSKVIAASDKLFLAANDTNLGHYDQLWKSDGTTGGTVAVKDFGSASMVWSNTSYATFSFSTVGDKLYFSPYTSTYGAEPWVSDGTTAGTILLKDIVAGGTTAGYPASGNSSASGGFFQWTAGDGKVYFTTQSGDLYSTDGTAAGTAKVNGISSVYGFESSTATMYLGGNDGTNGNELLSWDRTSLGLIKDINSGSSSAMPVYLTKMGGNFYFTPFQLNDSNGAELWKSDGTSGGTALVKDINSGSSGSNIASITVYNNKLYFSARSAQPNTTPSFVTGTAQSLSVAFNGAAVDLKSYLHVSDSDSSQTETWSQSVAPSHGTLSFSSATATSGSTDVTPGGTITYTPTTGYSGSDTFTVQVSDGNGGTATRVFNVTVASNVSPTFVTATAKTLSVSYNSAAIDLKPELHISDSDSSQTETWSQSVAPSHGSLSFSSATATSGSTDVTPGGTITYTPTTGYSGTDTFTVQVSDGTVTATRVFNITIAAKPADPAPPPPPPPPSAPPAPPVVVAPPVQPQPIAEPPKTIVRDTTPTPVFAPIQPPSPPAAPPVSDAPKGPSAGPTSDAPKTPVGEAPKVAVPLAPVVVAPPVIPVVMTPQFTPTASDGGFRVPVVTATQGGPPVEGLLALRPEVQVPPLTDGPMRVTIPLDAFVHSRSDAVVTLSAARVTGQPLPSWLNFDSRSGTLAGQPPADFKGTMVVRIVARDDKGQEATITVRINGLPEKTGAVQDSNVIKLGHHLRDKPTGKIAFTQQLKMAARNAAIRFS